MTQFNNSLTDLCFNFLLIITVLIIKIQYSAIFRLRHYILHIMTRISLSNFNLSTQGCICMWPVPYIQQLASIDWVKIWSDGTLWAKIVIIWLSVWFTGWLLRTHQNRMRLPPLSHRLSKEVLTNGHLEKKSITVYRLINLITLQVSSLPIFFFNNFFFQFIN